MKRYILYSIIATLLIIYGFGIWFILILNTLGEFKILLKSKDDAFLILIPKLLMWIVSTITGLWMIIYYKIFLKKFHPSSDYEGSCAVIVGCISITYLLTGILSGLIPILFFPTYYIIGTNVPDFYNVVGHSIFILGFIVGLFLWLIIMKWMKTYQDVYKK
jgi:hypothetical protein